MSKISSNIIHVIPSLDPPSGAENALYRLLSNQSDKALKPAIVVMMQKGALAYRLERELNMPVYELRMTQGKPNIVALVRYLKLVWKIKPKIVQSWMYHANFLTAIAKPFIPKHKLFFNIRHSLNDIANEKRFTRLMMKLNAWLSPFAAKVINNSEASIQQHEQIGFCKDNSIYIPNGFDVERFAPSSEAYTRFRESANLPFNTLLVGIVARYHATKNYPGFLAIAKKLLNDYKSNNLRFVLCGKGCEQENISLSSLIKEHGLQDYVLLMGGVDASQTLPAFDVYLSTSFGEGFPNVIGEAMACGVPVVATDVGGCRSVVGDGDFIFDVDDCEGMAKQIVHVLDMTDEQRQKLNARCRQKIYDCYRVEFVVSKYENLYTSYL